jgi:hypothetical protein
MYVCVGVCVCMCICMYVCMYVRVCACTYVRHGWLCKYVYACMYVHTHVYILIYASSLDSNHVDNSYPYKQIHTKRYFPVHADVDM